MTPEPQEKDRRERQLDELLAECLRLADSGSPPNVDEVLRDAPELREDLLELLGTSDMIDRMAGPVMEAAEAQAEFDPPPAKVDGQAETVAYLEATVAPSDGGKAAPKSAAARFTPRSFGGYELLEIIGQGGMGVVYKARQVNLNRIVAVKMIRAGRFANDDDLLRFYAEAQAAGKLGHHGIVNVHQVGEVDGHHFYSMDFVEGTTLQALAGSEDMTEERAARYLIAVADAIQHAHDEGILHRDLKPANVLIDQQDQPRVADFGLAKVIGEESGLTASGAALGTPGYMPPEQASGRLQEMGPASDVYSMGAVLYALLTGNPPFRGSSVVETIMQVLHDEPVPPRSINRRISSDLETICLKCLAKDPARRYASARELSDDLERFLAGDSILARPIGPVRRVANWLVGIPIIAALIGRRVQKPTVWHRRANWALLALPLAILFGLYAYTVALENFVPRHVVMATAKVGGAYDAFGKAFIGQWRRQTGFDGKALPTSGSIENRRALIDRDVQVALLQAEVLGDPLAVVAPLYDDYVHVVVRKDRGINKIEDLDGKAVAMGMADSGMLLTSRKLFEGFDIKPSEQVPHVVHFNCLETDERYDAAVVTTNPANDDLRRLLKDGRFELLNIVDAHRLHAAAYHAVILRRGCFFPAADDRDAIPAKDLTTLATTTFLAVHESASNSLVDELLETLYLPNGVAETFDVIDRKNAADWRPYSFHPAAKKYFDSLSDDRE